MKLRGSQTTEAISTTLMMLKEYYHLTKPGIIYGNSLAALAGFFLASQMHIHVVLLITMLVGLGLIIGGSCVFNNIYDRDMDARMERTKQRALASGKISKTQAAVFGNILLFLGAAILYLFTTPEACIMALIGFIVYVFAYTPLKRKSLHATLVGAISGAVPPVVGYTAVTGSLDLGAWLLFFILVFWQMPHFYAIALRRRGDYGAANIPTLIAKKGPHTAKLHILLYISGYLVTIVLLWAYSYAGLFYLVAMVALGIQWLALAIRGFKTSDDEAWAKKIFLFSLVVLLAFSVVIPLDIAIRRL